MQDNISRYTEKDLNNILSNELGEKYISYRKEWNSISYNNFPDFPLHIDFEMQDSCNQSCIMCPRNTKKHPNINYKVNTNSKLSFDLFKKAIDEGKNNGLRSINLGAFAEPLLNKDVFKMIKYATDNGIVDTRIITNGLMLGKYIDDIFDSGLVNLFVSLDAFYENTYNDIRGKGMSLVKSALEKFLEERSLRKSILPITRVSFVDMKKNRDEKMKFIEFWRDKVDFIDIQIFDNYNIDINGEFDFSVHKKWNCFSPFARVAVLSNGDILPCCNFFGRNIPIGNIKIISIKDAFNSKKMNNIRQGILNDSLRNCSICQRIGE